MNNSGFSKGKGNVVTKKSKANKQASGSVTPVSGTGASGRAAAIALPTASPSPAPSPVPPLFRKIDWLALAIAFIGVWIVYLYTLAPEQTLEDSGELCTGSFYAGIPHPPGYPFWSIYSWFWTAILPFGNVAWRVEVGESFAAAIGCGLLALMVSRGSSMLIEGIEELKTISKQWETAICFVSGTVAGLLLGLGQFMWIESDVINRISLFGVPWLLGMLVLLMRWSYAPHQRRYLYWAMLFFGWLATIHQSLIISVAGIEVLVALVSPRLGRDLFVWNSIGYVAILLLMATGTIPAINAMTGTEKWIFHFVGLGSTAAWTGIYLKTFINSRQLKRDWLKWFWGALLATSGIILLLFLMLVIFQPAPNSPSEKSFLELSNIAATILEVTAGLYGVVLGVISLVCIWTGIASRQFGRELWTGLLLGLVWVVGVSVYLYEPISCMTDPPMQWGYPRTVEGFFHTLSRGQYGSDNGLNLLQNPRQFLFQLYYLADGLSESFTWAYLFVGLIPFVFINRMRKRERNWIIGVSAIYFWISVMLVIMLNVSADRSTSELNKVFFTASHSLFAMMIGYGVTILAAYVATHYEKIRGWCFAGAGFALLAALYCLISAIDRVYFGPTGQLRVWVPFSSWSGWSFLAYGPDGQYGISEIPHWIAQAFAKDQFGMPIFGNLILVALPIIFLIALFVYRTRGQAVMVILLALFAVTPLCSGLSHWYKCEQRNHWFGYWFGHDMFTPPFLDNGKLSYDDSRRAELLKDPKEGRLIYPEMARNAILFGGTDPGRFCPTYMIFCESFIPHYCQPKQDRKFDRRDVYIITQNALADTTYLDYLRAQYFRSHQHDPPFFSELSRYLFSIAIHSWRIRLGYNIDKHRNDTQDQLTREGLSGDDVQREGQEEGNHDDAVASSGLYGLVDKALYNILDRPALAWGRHVEAYRRAEGVYPPKEIYIPTDQDSQVCFNEYYADVQRRIQTGQLQPGEDVTMSPDGKMQVSGEGSVMIINGMLCKVIFDNNPTNEFYVQESFPLPWMYPYETPFGIIMKINRNPVSELTRDDFDRDHKFWCDYSRRLCGDWITYDTTIQEITNFVQRTYIQNNFKGFTGDRRFVRDEDAQKHFSGLRSSQAGMYAWRCNPACPAEFREQTPALEKALERETDFAYKQAFALCPYSPEAVFHYVNFLMQFNRLDDALLVAQTCLKLDPYNSAVSGLVDGLEKIKNQSGERVRMNQQVQDAENKARTNPTDYQNILQLAGYYLHTRQTNRATELLGQTVARPDVPSAVLQVVAQFFFQSGQYSELEPVLKKLAADQPNDPEAWYDLARLEVVLGKRDEAIRDLQTSIELSDARLKTNPAARDLRSAARTEGGFNPIRASPEFQKLVPQ